MSALSANEVISYTVLHTPEGRPYSAQRNEVRDLRGHLRALEAENARVVKVLRNKVVTITYDSEDITDQVT